MAGSHRHRWQGPLAAALLLAVAAAAMAQTAAQTGALRGYQVPDKPAPKAAPAEPPLVPTAPEFDPGNGPPPLADLSPIPRFQDDPAPRFNLDPAPRVQGLDLRGGGAACRTSCADARYICRANEPVDVCDSTWEQCVAGCGESSPTAP